MDPVHRVSPGTVVFHDGRSQGEHPDLGLEPAAVVFTRVVSRPAPDIVTCDAGSKAIAVDAGDPCVTVLHHPELRALTPSEEHLPLRVIGGVAPERGTPLFLAPRHVCPTVNLADAAVLIEGGEIRALVPVGARGHDIGIER
jgi:D-serine deaminase-like pyridoxal phosphate-dependent protein